MAAPRVFISSTCYDLAEERDGLAEFCASFGFDTTLSERGDVFYHPDLHTHISCVRETANCQIFILIIGGRFGGKYKVDPTKSITNAEYAAAVQNGSPTFAFVKQDVLNDHNVWQRNKDFAFAKEIQYPSIDKQEHAEEIFKFIDSVRHAPVNNGLFAFRLAKDIQETLRKQWAGMMFDYLQNRTIAKQLALTNDALGNLSVVSAKIEDLVKNIYRNVDAAGAPSAIENIENESSAEEFLMKLAVLLNDDKFIYKNNFEKAVGMPEKWWDFATNFGWGKLGEKTMPDGSLGICLFDFFDDELQVISGSMNKNDKNRVDSLQRSYEKFRSLPKEARDRLASKYIFISSDEKNEGDASS
jgi:hypothetical protein